jgi:hypothetical protein
MFNYNPGKPKNIGGVLFVKNIKTPPFSCVCPVYMGLFRFLPLSKHRTIKETRLPT